MNWIVAFRDKGTHEIVGPLWFFDGVERKPTHWAKKACYVGCDYAIMDGQGYDWDTGVPDRVLQVLHWEKGENVVNRVPSFSEDTMAMQGPLVDASTADMLVYCDPWCAEQGYASEDSLFEVSPQEGDVCAFCGKKLGVQEQ